jgi:hypothetical protein
VAVFSQLAACTAAVPSTSPPDFSFKNGLVHPADVERLLGDLAGEQCDIAEVDLEESADLLADRPQVVLRNGTVSASDPSRGFAAYRHVGHTPSELHVLILWRGGSGSGVFKDVLWLRVDLDRTSHHTRLRRVGQFTLGDRDNAALKLSGSKLLIGASKYRHEQTVIDLD